LTPQQVQRDLPMSPKDWRARSALLYNSERLHERDSSRCSRAADAVGLLSRAIRP